MAESVFPPRGHHASGRQGSDLPSALWADPAALPETEWTWQPGRVLLGQWEGRYYGISDDRHLVMVAGSRAGKTQTVIVPNLRNYAGPCIVIDPKGELVKDTADHRENVHILDPFGVTGRPSASHNPFEELNDHSTHISADAAQLADALIIQPEGSADPYWTDSARNLLTGLILYLLYKRPKTATLAKLRDLLHASVAELHQIFTEMSLSIDVWGDATMANSGASFLSMFELDDIGQAVSVTREMNSILSAARQQTASLDQVVNVMSSSTFAMPDISRHNLTIYLVLPASRIGTHYRWLRLFIMQAFRAMEANPIPRGRLPAWFVLEEFAALGYVRAIETAAGYLAGYGVKLWVVLQDLTQLRRHYKESWETFLGNAGVTMAFGNVDATTTAYLSKLLGQTTVRETESQPTTPGQRDAGDAGIRTSYHRVPLMTPDEIAYHFAGKTKRALIYVPDSADHPVYLNRLPPPKEPKA